MTPPIDRDAALHQGLTRLDARASAVGPDCLDAEVLAAWTDGSLGQAEVKRATAHTAGCPRCQALLGAMMRDEALAGDTDARDVGAHAGDGESDRAAGGARVLAWRRPWVRWFVPLSAAATIVLATFVWLRTPGLDKTQEPAANRETERRDTTRVERPGNEPAANAGAAPAPQPPAPAEGPPAASAVVPGTLEPPRDSRTPSAASSELRARDAAGSNASMPAQTATAPETADDRQPPGTNASGGRAAAVPTAAEAAAPAAPAPPAMPAPSAARRDRLEFASASPRWRIVDGQLQRSDDGRTWTPSPEPAIGASITALSANIGTVVWAVGRAGVVLRTADGTEWSRVRFPEPADLVGVQASDGSTAIVRAADGRAWSTSDGGATWASVR